MSKIYGNECACGIIDWWETIGECRDHQKAQWTPECGIRRVHIEINGNRLCTPVGIRADEASHVWVPRRDHRDDGFTVSWLQLEPRA